MHDGLFALNPQGSTSEFQEGGERDQPKMKPEQCHHGDHQLVHEEASVMEHKVAKTIENIILVLNGVIFENGDLKKVYKELNERINTIEYKLKDSIEHNSNLLKDIQKREYIKIHLFQSLIYTFYTDLR